MKPSTMISAAGLAAFLLVSVRSDAAPPAPANPAQEIAQLQAEVRELRALIMQLTRDEQGHYNLLLSLVQPRQGSGGLPAPPLPTPPGGPAKLGDVGAAPTVPHLSPRTASLRGKVQFVGGNQPDVYAYVENVKSPPVRGKTVDIAQRGKRFVPDVLVVQRGTKVSFPNYDNVFHNVFSPTQPRPFDLGRYRQGDEPKSVDMMSPGVVDVFCDIHSDMRASILVVPSPIFTRVGADGSFHLDGIPLGSRTLVIWGPRSKPTKQTIEVSATGADVTLSLEHQDAAAHQTKTGQAYPQYPKE